MTLLWHGPHWISWGFLFCWASLGSRQSSLVLFHFSCCIYPRKNCVRVLSALMSLSCSHQIPIGPPPTCSAQGLHCCSVCADFCSSSSYVSVVPGHGPCSKFDTGPAVSLWTCLLIMRMCLTLATAATRGLTLP